MRIIILLEYVTHILISESTDLPVQTYQCISYVHNLKRSSLSYFPVYPQFLAGEPGSCSAAPWVSVLNHSHHAWVFAHRTPILSPRVSSRPWVIPSLVFLPQGPQFKGAPIGSDPPHLPPRSRFFRKSHLPSWRTLSLVRECYLFYV